jgi:hypothetical protein
VRAALDVGEVEHPLGEALEKARRAALEHIAARAQQRGAGRELAADREQIVFVAAGAMEQQQRRGGQITGGLEDVLLGERGHQRAEGAERRTAKLV